MEQTPLVLSYACPEETNSQTTIAQAAAIGTLVSSGIVAGVFFHLRLEVERVHARNWGNWCGNPIMNAMFNVQASVVLLIIPAALWFTARRNRAYPRMTRTALVCAIATWLICVASL
jgi:hypothetical protein